MAASPFPCFFSTYFLIVISIYKRSILEITVFVCGALVMVFEIIGSRLLSPFIGTSTYVWTSLIGVILASLSLGYWFGGRLADRLPSVKVLASLIFAAGGLISVTILIKDVALSLIGSASIPLEIKALIASLLLFAPASVFLGCVTPFAVRLKMTSLAETGTTVGRLYALSTVGSIVGTFGAGFFLIPFVGSVRTLYLIAASLMALAIALTPLVVSKINISAIILLALGITASEARSALLRDASGLYDIDTQYSHIQVFQTTDPETKKPIVALATDPYFIQSAMFLDSDQLVFDYARYYHLIEYFKPDFSETLAVGGAGYSFPKEYLRSYDTARIDVVEIDPGMTQIAREHFRLRDDPRMSIIHQDGRMFINHAPTGKYDAVLMDAFGSLFSVPYHLTTLEAVKDFHRVLKDDGVIIFNLGSAISGEGSRFLQAEIKTYQQVFPHVYLFKVHPEYPDDRMQNLIIIASKSDDPARLIPDDPGGRIPKIDQQTADLLAHRYQFAITSTDNILTDDLAPVEYYNSIAQNLYLRNR